MDWTDPAAVRAYHREYRQRNLERRREQDRSYAAAHREEAKTKARAWYMANRARVAAHKKATDDSAKKRAYDRERRRKIGDVLRAYDRARRTTEQRRRTDREWRERNRAIVVARVCAWALANPERARALQQATHDRRRARLAGAAYEHIDRRELAARDRHLCGICRRRVKASERSLDHIVPIALGGAHIWSNVQLAHLTCNKRKGARLLNAQLRLL